MHTQWLDPLLIAHHLKMKNIIQWSWKSFLQLADLKLLMDSGLVQEKRRLLSYFYSNEHRPLLYFAESNVRCDYCFAVILIIFMSKINSSCSCLQEQLSCLLIFHWLTINWLGLKLLFRIFCDTFLLNIIVDGLV